MSWIHRGLLTEPPLHLQLHTVTGITTSSSPMPTASVTFGFHSQALTVAWPTTYNRSFDRTELRGSAPSWRSHARNSRCGALIPRPDRHEARRLRLLHPPVAHVERRELDPVGRYQRPRPRIAPAQTGARSGARLYDPVRESSRSLRGTSGSRLSKGRPGSSRRNCRIDSGPPPLPRALGSDDRAGASTYGARVGAVGLGRRRRQLHAAARLRPGLLLQPLQDRGQEVRPVVCRVRRVLQFLLHPPDVRWRQRAAVLRTR